MLDSMTWLLNVLIFGGLAFSAVFLTTQDRAASIVAAIASAMAVLNAVAWLT